jgi:hypothetical protein
MRLVAEALAVAFEGEKESPHHRMIAQAAK